MFEYFGELRVAASSAAEEASRAAATANRQMTVTSQVSGFPASQGTRERPSGRSLLLLFFLKSPPAQSRRQEN